MLNKVLNFNMKPVEHICNSLIKAHSSMYFIPIMKLSHKHFRGKDTHDSPLLQSRSKFNTLGHAGSILRCHCH